MGCDDATDMRGSISLTGNVHRLQLLYVCARHAGHGRERRDASKGRSGRRFVYGDEVEYPQRSERWRERHIIIWHIENTTNPAMSVCVYALFHNSCLTPCLLYVCMCAMSVPSHAFHTRGSFAPYANGMCIRFCAHSN